MRIRKRALKLPLSLLSPVALQPSDLQLVQLKAYEDDDKNEDQRKEEEISNIPSKQGDSGAIAVADNGVFPSLSPPSGQKKVTISGRWCDGDKTIPLKKRKACLEMSNDIVVSSSKMKSKTNKKCTLLTTFDEDDDDDYSIDHDSDSISTDDDKKKKKKAGKSKKKKGGRVIMEGSRCSRVNGRGWRCMQPTLVGYSLCEHHLGKGRLRSISSVDNIPLAKPDVAGELGSKRKRMRVGMVKARSLSSLLCQPNTSVVHLGSPTTTT